MRLDEALRSGRCIAIDVEGDGRHPSRPVEIAIVRVGEVTNDCLLHSLVNPGTAIVPFVSGIHGIRDEDVRGAPSLHELAPRIAELLRGMVVVGHAILDDLDMLRTGIPDVDTIPDVLVDTQRLARNVVPALPRYGLSSVAGVLGIDDQPGLGERSGPHSAIADAFMAARMLVSLVSLVPSDRMAHVSRSATAVASNRRLRRFREASERELDNECPRNGDPMP